jgi:hypothetical protein
MLILNIHNFYYSYLKNLVKYQSQIFLKALQAVKRIAMQQFSKCLANIL